MLLLGSAGVVRRSELVRIGLAHIEETAHGLPIKLPWPNGDRPG